jgi:nucleolin
VSGATSEGRGRAGRSDVCLVSCPFFVREGRRGFVCPWSAHFPTIHALFFRRTNTLNAHIMVEQSKSEGSSSGRKRRRRSGKRGGGKNDDENEIDDDAAIAADSESFVVDSPPPDVGGGGDAMSSSLGEDDAGDGAATATTDGTKTSEPTGRDDEDDGDDVDGNEGKRKRKRNRKKKSVDDENANNNPSDAATAPTAIKRREELLQSVEHTVFVEGLPFTCTPDQVRHFFEVHGCADVLEMRLPTWQDSGRLRGFGHVVFASTTSRARSLGSDVNGKELGGRYVTVREANVPRAGTTMGASTLGGGTTRDQPTGCKTVFVRNLPYDASEDDVLESFRIFGKIVEGGVRVARNHVTGISKGFGYVEYKNEEGALGAVQRAAKPFGVMVMKRPVFVDYDEGTMRGSYRDGDGKLWSKAHDAKQGGGGGSGRGGMRGGGGGGRGRGRGTNFGGGRGHG